MPGLAAPPGYGDTAGVFTALSCSSAGNCGASGIYTDDRGHVQPFVVSEKRGVWGNAEDVSGLAKLNTGQQPRQRAPLRWSPATTLAIPRHQAGTVSRMVSLVPPGSLARRGSALACPRPTPQGRNGITELLAADKAR
jgi:hypothetical protein